MPLKNSNFSRSRKKRTLDKKYKIILSLHHENVNQLNEIILKKLKSKKEHILEIAFSAQPNSAENFPVKIVLQIFFVAWEYYNL